MNGDPNNLLIGWDSDQNGCGFSEATKDYPYLYFPQSPSMDQIERISNGDLRDIITLLKSGACVKECPTANQLDPV